MVYKGYVCGHCEDCLEAHCCAELDTCVLDDECFYCVFAGHPVDAGFLDCSKTPLETAYQAKALRDCMQQYCKPNCYSKMPTGSGGGGEGAGGNCGGSGGRGGGGNGGNPH